MGKNKSPSGISLLNATPMGPMYQKAYLPEDSGPDYFEGKTPLSKEQIISKYHGGVYKLYTDGTITSPTNKKLKCKFIKGVKRPYISIRVKKKDDKGKSYTHIEAKSVGKLMEKYFGEYIPGYKEKKQNPKEYKLEPKDLNYANFRLDNLVYVKKCNYDILNELYSVFEPVFSDDISGLIKYICDNFSLNRNSAIRKIEQFAKGRKCSAFENYQSLKELLGIDFSMDMYKVYKLLIKTKGELKDLEITIKIRPNISGENESHYSSKVSRVRSKLKKKGIFSAIEMINTKFITGKTNQDIANILNLPEKTVIDLDSMLQINSNAK